MKTMSSVTCVTVLCALAGLAYGGASLNLQPQPTQPAEPAAAATDTTTAAAATDAAHINPKATFAFTNERFHDDPEILWPGFLNGLRGFEQFYNPVGNPLYFETPLNNTSARLLYIHHDFAEHSQLQGGHADIAAVQVRVALTERLGFIATKDGYSWLHTGALGDNEGWNSIAAGVKYAVIADKDEDFLLTPGVRVMFNSGKSTALQSGVTEFSPFISAAKGWDKFHLMGDFCVRLPTDDDRGNNIIQWDVHTDYEIFDGFAPMFELHGLHYLDNGTALPFKIGGLDYSNFGSANVGGSSVIWFGVGGRWKLTPQVSVGATYEHALTNENADLMKQRVTVDIELTW